LDQLSTQNPRVSTVPPAATRGLGRRSRVARHAQRPRPYRNVPGKAGRAMLDTLLSGTTDREILAGLAEGHAALEDPGARLEPKQGVIDTRAAPSGRRAG
jgi:hypothetical protein